MRSKFLLWSVSFVILSILVSANVLAEDQDIRDSKRNDFTARLQHINCRIKLTEKQLDILSALNSSISSYKELLDADYAKLQEFASALNHKEFSNYFTTTFKDNLKSSVKAVKDTKSEFKASELTKEKKDSLKSNHKSAISEFADCVNKADKEWVEARAGYLNSWIKRWNNVIMKMKDKGYDTSELENIIADAQTKLLPDLEAIKSVEAKAARKSAMENARNLHLHLWARFEIARIRSYLKFIEIDAISKGYQTEIDAIKASLDDTSKLVIAGKKYKEGEFQKVWMSIKDIVQMLKELNKKLKG